MAGYGARVPYLVVRGPGQFAGARFELTRDVHVVGRFGDIRLASPDVSKRHAELRRGSDGVWVSDLHSSNGVLYNGVRLAPERPVRLGDGDVLQFGSVKVEFHRNGYGVADLRDPRRTTQRPAGPAADPDLPTGPMRNADPPPITDDARSSSTRYLAAATQLDPWFADVVVRQVVDEPYRALAPVFGADLGIVTRWAIGARRRRLVRDLVLTAALVALLTLLGTGVRNQFDIIKSGDLGGTWWQPYAVGGAAMFVLAWLTLAVDLWVTAYLVLRRRLAPARYEPAQAPHPMTRRVRTRLDTVAERPSGNLIVCSGYWPFAGSGDQIDTWEMPIDIRHGSTKPDGSRRTPLPLDTGELYDVLIAAARLIGLDNLRVEERLFVDGLNVARDPNLLPDRERPPLSRVPVPVMRTMPDGLGATKRSYVSIEVPAWSGQSVLTMYLRAVVVHGTLYLEWSAHALLPMRAWYYTVDNLPHRTAAGAAAVALGHALPRVPRALAAAPRALLRRAAEACRTAAERRRQRSTIRGGYRFDYGASLSIREYASGDDEGRYYIGRDLTRALFTTQQHLLNTVGDFLRSKGIASEQFDRFQQNLVQNFNDNRVQAQNVQGHVFGHVNSARAGNYSGGSAPPQGRAGAQN
ncbi:FHA domain-containing protein [Streptomyces sp. S.PB5]|uniref:FHA domain-containing protein n=1 Tax=Streptomyces sp. S.PB5 TaxID=3020844 RepID=UPI0025B02B9A|nr:FHA domain-containing protein [Streptomyces sp. S.PB5]MDN3026448.1 FHA domain-containing protein [Streptomyces sp. S.PB5]